MHADHASGSADIALPAEGRGLLHRYARRHVGRQHAVLIGFALVLEDVPRGHRDHARADAVREELLVRVDAEADLAARGDQDHVGLAAGRIRQHVGAARDAGRRRILAAVERRQRLPRQRQHGRLVAQLHDVTISFDHLVGVAGTQHHQARLGAERCELLHRLMRRAVLAVAHGVVGEHEDRRQLHQRGDPDRRPCIIAEDEEGSAEGADLRQGEPVDRCGHGVLANAEMQVAPAERARFEVAGALEGQQRLVRRAEVGRAAHEPRDILREHVEHLAGSIAARDALGVGREGRQALVPSLRQLAPLHQVDLGREPRIARPVDLKQLVPACMGLGATRADSGGEALAHGLRHQELGVLGPTVETLGEADLLLAQGLAMRRRGIVLVRRAVADVAVEDDEGRPALGAAEDVDRVLDARGVVGITDAQHVPAVAQEARRNILGEGDLRLAFDGDVVVVVDPAQVVEAEMAGERGGLGGDSLHHAAIAAHRVDVVVEDREVRTIEVVGEPGLGDRHADAGGDALAERPGRGLHAGYPVIFGMAGCLAVELAEAADVVEGDRRRAQPLVVGIHGAGLGEEQRRPQQHRGVAVGQHEAVAVGPDRVLGVEAHDPVPQRVDQRRQRHRRAGMAGLRLLDRIDRQGADAVDRQLVELDFCHRRVGARGGGRGDAGGSIHLCASSFCLAPSGPAAAGSASTSARTCSTRPAGIERSPAHMRASACVFSPPVTSHRTRRARLMIGKVNVMRRRPW